MHKSPAPLAQLRLSQAAMLEDLAALVACETPSDDRAACDAGAGLVAQMGERLLGVPPTEVVVDGRRHLQWRFGEPDTRGVLLLGHYDTVWPLGTIDRSPFHVGAGIATGPGCFDMKAGLVQLFYSVASLAHRDGVEILITADEEVGSQTSRAVIIEAAQRARAALVLEGAAGGSLKHARKGTGMYQFTITGRAAHAGLEPEQGVNALTELAHIVLQVEQIGRPDLGTSVTATIGRSGSANNVVPPSAWLEIDVRAEEPAELDRVDATLRAIRPTVPGATLNLTGGPTRSPMTQHQAAPLLAAAQAIASELGIDLPGAVAVGGASDGNITATADCPTLDGLGAVGGNAHAEGEFVSVSAMPERAALLAGLVERILASNSATY